LIPGKCMHKERKNRHHLSRKQRHSSGPFLLKASDVLDWRERAREREGAGNIHQMISLVQFRTFPRCVNMRNIYIYTSVWLSWTVVPRCVKYPEKSRLSLSIPDPLA
jgi:hypothetical protein